MHTSAPLILAIVLIVLPGLGGRAAAEGLLCDPSFENCRRPLLRLIEREQAGIDVAFWFMKDSRFANALIARWRAGVPVRVLVDQKANKSYPSNAGNLRRLAEAGIPMRERTGGYLHWKMMLFAGQNVVQFSAANYSANAFVPNQPLVDFVDEVVYFADDPAIVNSFKTKYDDTWVGGGGFRDFANVTQPARRYDRFPMHPDVNFPPAQSFAARSVRAYDAESDSIDSVMYRITDRRHTDALIRALRRGVTVRLLVEPEQYRDVRRLWHAWNVDRLHAAGVEIRSRRHRGLSHEKLTLLGGQRMAIFGSSNWTESTAPTQFDHNLFSREAWIYRGARPHFDRRWASGSETEPFEPLRPTAPVYRAPQHGECGVPRDVRLQWHGGPWAHRYDVYLGTHPDAMQRVLADAELGPSITETDTKSHRLSGLDAGTTYYWKVVSRTMADRQRSGPVARFCTAA